MLGTGHATATTIAATSSTTAQQQQRKRVSMMEAAQGITIALGQTVTVQLDAPPDAVRYTLHTTRHKRIAKTCSAVYTMHMHSITVLLLIAHCKAETPWIA
jgi:hypothetical protein